MTATIVWAAVILIWVWGALSAYNIRHRRPFDIRDLWRK